MYGASTRFKRGFNGTPGWKLAGSSTTFTSPSKAKMVDQAIALNGAMRTVKLETQHKIDLASGQCV